MRKTAEAEQQLELAILNIVVRNPLISVSALRERLKDKGFKTAQGNPLDWYYVAKVEDLNRATIAEARRFLPSLKAGWAS